MKKIIFLIISLILILAGAFFILNVEVTSRQGIDYQVRTLRLPLYLKILDFYDRHYNYKWLVNKIIKDKTGDGERVMAIFRWTAENIAEQPEQLRVVDDHAWHIILRGYGTADQFQDVFTTLCNYADFDAFFSRLYNEDSASRIIISFVKIAGKWCIFDAQSGVYFVNNEKQGSFASVEDIAGGNWAIKSIADSGNLQKDYADYFDKILTIDLEKSHKLSRSNIQSPVNRLIYGVIKGKF